MTHEFLDTNVLLYAYDVTAGDRHGRAKALVSRLGRTRRAAVSVQVLQEFYVNVVRKIEVPLSPEVARERLLVFSRWRVHAPGPEDVIAATELAQRTQISFWDAMIVRSAAECGCRVLWSEDLNAGQHIEGVEVVNPFTG